MGGTVGYGYVRERTGGAGRSAFRPKRMAVPLLRHGFFGIEWRPGMLTNRRLGIDRCGLIVKMCVGCVAYFHAFGELLLQAYGTVMLPDLRLKSVRSALKCDTLVFWAYYQGSSIIHRLIYIFSTLASSREDARCEQHTHRTVY
jgi:hypothetical protein